MASLGTGTAFWTVASVLSLPQEAWDHQFWFVYLLLAYLLCAVFGFVFPRRPWRWALSMMLPLFVVMPMVTGRSGPLFMVGLMFVLAYSLPGMAIAGFGAAMRKRVTQRGRA